MLDAMPAPVTENTDGSESEVFTLDEVDPVPATAAAVLALDADGSGSGKSLPAVSKAEASIPESGITDVRPASQPRSDSSLKPAVKIGIMALNAPEPQPDTGATPAPRVAFGSAPVTKRDANATPMPRAAFGSGVQPAIVVGTVAETVVPAEGRRPAVRITFVKPGEKSPIKK